MSFWWYCFQNSWNDEVVTWTIENRCQRQYLRRRGLGGACSTWWESTPRKMWWLNVVDLPLACPEDRSRWILQKCVVGAGRFSEGSLRLVIYIHFALTMPANLWLLCVSDEFRMRYPKIIQNRDWAEACKARNKARNTPWGCIEDSESVTWMTMNTQLCLCIPMPFKFWWRHVTVLQGSRRLCWFFNSSFLGRGAGLRIDWALTFRGKLVPRIWLAKVRPNKPVWFGDSMVCNCHMSCHMAKTKEMTGSHVSTPHQVVTSIGTSLWKGWKRCLP